MTTSGSNDVQPTKAFVLCEAFWSQTLWNWPSWSVSKDEPVVLSELFNGLSERLQQNNFDGTETPLESWGVKHLSPALS